MDPAAPETYVPGHGSKPSLNIPRSLAASLLSYVEARGVLLSLEAQEALRILLSVVIFAIIGGILAFCGWLFVAGFLTALLIDQTGWEWPKALAVMGGAHLLGALIFFGGAYLRIMSSRWFADTINELKKDRAWLAEQTKKN